MATKTVNGNTLDVPDLTSKKAEVKIGTILRMLFLVAAYINQICEVIGVYNAFIPQEYQSVVATVSLIATGAASVCAYWFNNSWSVEATTVDKLLLTIKNASQYCPDIVDSVNASVAEFNKKQAQAAAEMTFSGTGQEAVKK